jgi:hypothetical protein
MVVSGAAKNFFPGHTIRLASPANQSLKLRPSLARAE